MAAPLAVDSAKNVETEEDSTKKRKRTEEESVEKGTATATAESAAAAAAAGVVAPAESMEEGQPPAKVLKVQHGEGVVAGAAAVAAVAVDVE